jgi:hypothetical protein
MTRTQPHRHSLRQPGRVIALVLLTLALPLFLGAWSISMNRNINARYVERIQDGKTKKSEILTLFGDPQEIKRTPDGIIFVYKTFRTKQPAPSYKATKDEDTKTGAAVESPFTLEETLKRKPKEGPVQEESSVLTIYFGADGDTVRSHDFKEL